MQEVAVKDANNQLLADANGNVARLSNVEEKDMRKDFHSLLSHLNCPTVLEDL